MCACAYVRACAYVGVYLWSKAGLKPKVSGVRVYATPTVQSVTFDLRSNPTDENPAGFDMKDAAVASEGLLMPGSAPGSEKFYRFCNFYFCVEATL